jgi:hypothetical protein
MNVVTEQGFPHGLRCIRCDERIPVGDTYVSVPNGMAGDAFVSELVCHGCAD